MIRRVCVVEGVIVPFRVRIVAEKMPPLFFRQRSSRCSALLQVISYDYYC
jgi:hypothetical protein